MNATTYLRRKEAGLCAWCGNKLPEGYKYVICPECKEKENEKRRARWNQRNHEETKKPRQTPKPVAKPRVSLDDMVILARLQGVTYGKLQQIETMERLRG